MPDPIDPRALAAAMLAQGRSLAEIRNALSANDVPLETIEEISGELEEPLAVRERDDLLQARQDVRAGIMMVVASIAITVLIVLAAFRSQLVYIIPAVAATVGVVRAARGAAKLRGGTGVKGAVVSQSNRQP